MRTPMVLKILNLSENMYLSTLSPPENPIAIQSHPPDIFSVTLNHDHTCI